MRRGRDEMERDGDRSSRKRWRSQIAEEEEEDYGGGRRRHGEKGCPFLDVEARVDSDEEEEEEEGEDDFIVDGGTDLPDEDDSRRIHCPQLLPQDDEQEDVEALERRIQARYSRSGQTEYDEEITDVEQQALLPSVRDPKLWLVKCAIGHEREAAVCFMQKYIDKGSKLRIWSATALDHLKNYIYVEADNETHVREACKGLRSIYPQMVLVPIKEMTEVLSVQSKAVGLCRDTWIRMKTGKYKGDLAKVVDVDNVGQRVKVQLIPRIDLQALANKLEGREVAKKKPFVPPQRLMNVNEARDLHIRVARKRDPTTNDYFDSIGGMLFKDGFLYKMVSMRSISSQNITPSFDELDKFCTCGEDGENDIARLFSKEKKGNFMKGDAVIVVKGDLINLKGKVEKVDEENVHITPERRPEMKGLPKTLAFNQKELCKYFERGNHVKVISGKQQGVTGMVIQAERHVLTILSDTTKEHIDVFADDVVVSSEVNDTTSIEGYELRDLVLLDNNSFGVIISVETEAIQVLKGVPGRPEVALVKLGEIKWKIKKSSNGQDKIKNSISVKDVVKILEGPCKGKQGPVEHIFRGILFVYDRHHLEHAGIICAKASSCIVVGGSGANGGRNGNAYTRFDSARTPHSIAQSQMRFPQGGPLVDNGGRQRSGLEGASVKILHGPFKGFKGLVKGVEGQLVRIELQARMQVVTVDRSFISDNVTMHPSRTPMHSYMTPRRAEGATPIHDGMRTPVLDGAWNPYSPMIPPRDNWEDGNPASWGSGPQYQSGSPSYAYEAPTPGSDWANTPGGIYSEAGTPRDSSSAYANAPSPCLPSTPGGKPMTPNSALYLTGTPGGQPMTPGTGGLDVISPVIGSDNEGPLFMPNIVVNVHRSGEDSVGVIREVLPDGSCRVDLGLRTNGETITALPTEIEIVPPGKNDKIKIVGGSQRGATGKLIGVDGTDGIVKVDDTLDVKILDMVVLAKLA